MLLFRNSSVFVVDEFSMLHNQHLNTMLQRIMQAQYRSCLDDVLANNLILLVGDHAQLPPVRACSGHFKIDEVCPMHHLSYNSVFREAVVAGAFHDLSVNHRCGKFAEFLNRVRSATPDNPLTQAEIATALGELVGPEYVPTPDICIMTQAAAR